MPFKTNLFLDALLAKDRGPLSALLTPVKLDTGQLLFGPREKISHVYFPTDAVISHFATLSHGTVEVALAGRDGVVGAAAIEGCVASSGAMVRIEGHALRGDGSALISHLSKNQNVRALLRDHQDVVFAQVLQSAACAASHSVEERLASWMKPVNPTVPGTKPAYAAIVSASSSVVPLGTFSFIKSTPCRSFVGSSPRKLIPAKVLEVGRHGVLS